MTTQLTPPSVATVKAVVSFCRHFNADLIRIIAANASAIDDIPSLFIVFEGVSYAGPDLLLNRVRDLTNRLALPDSTISVVTGGTEDKPKSLQIKSGRSTIDFRLAASTSGSRVPSKFTGVLIHELELDRSDLAAAIAGASSIGSKLLTFVGDGKHLTLTAQSESETYTSQLTEVTVSSVFQYNYTVEYLQSVDKLLPKATKTVMFGISTKGHMRITLPTELKQINAEVYLLDVKDR